MFREAILPLGAGLARGGAHVRLGRKDPDGVIESARDVLLLLKERRTVYRRIGQVSVAGLFMGVKGRAQSRHGIRLTVQLGRRFLDLICDDPGADTVASAPRRRATSMSANDLDHSVLRLRCVRSVAPLRQRRQLRYRFSRYRSCRSRAGHRRGRQPPPEQGRPASCSSSA